jgi:glycosyl transferase, family 25
MPDLPILYINLDSDVERHQRMQAQFQRLGLKAERFPATRWTDLPPAEQARLFSPALNARQFYKPLVNGEKGCYASHLRVCQWLLDSPHAAVVVLEDDVRLEPDIERVSNAIAALPPGWDLVKLIGRVNGHEDEKLLRRRPLTEGFELIDFARVPSMTAGHVLSRSGAQKLLAARLPFGRPVDVDLRHWWEHSGGGLRIHGVLPAVIALDETSQQSSIGSTNLHGLSAQWRRFCHKAAYTTLNYWHGQHPRDL